MGSPLKIAIVVPDNRDEFRAYADPLPHFGTAPTALLEGFAELRDCEVHVVCCVQRPLAMPEKLAPNIFYHAEIVPKWGWLRGGYWGCVRSIRRQLKKIQPDIVHGQGTERYCALSAVRSGFPNVVTIHGNMNAIAQMYRSRVGSYNWLAARWENFTLPRTGGIICISDYVKDLITRHQVPAWIVPNAIRKMFFEYPRAATGARERPLLINVGVISERKRQQQLLATLCSLREEGRHFDTVFVGAANDASPYAQKFVTQLAEAHRKHGGFEHVRKPDDDALCRLMNNASAMIHFSNEETFGLTFAEAIARGLYLFASDVGAIRDIARGVGSVEILGLNDWDALKQSLRQWLQSASWKQPKPESPPTEFCERYAPEAVAQRHVAIYREVLNRRS